MMTETQPLTPEERFIRKMVEAGFSFEPDDAATVLAIVHDCLHEATAAAEARIKELDAAFRFQLRRAQEEADAALAAEKRTIAWRRAAESLVPAGSEYVGDPEAIAEAVRQSREGLLEQLRQAQARARDAEARELALLERIDAEMRHHEQQIQANVRAERARRAREDGA